MGSIFLIMPFFSVIIPLYNKSNFIKNTIESILNQIFQDFEIIIVEDCSTDNSLEIAKTVISDKIRIIRHEKNKGLSASRNTGIRNANSKYIAFLDADDLWKPNYLEKINSLINKFPEASLFATNYEELYPNNVTVLPSTNIKNFNKDGIIEDFFESNLSQSIYCACSLCVEKSVFEKIGFYNEEITFAEDIDFNIRANNRFKLAYSKEPLVTYTLLLENQITNTALKNKIIPDFDSYEEIASKNPSFKKYLDFNRYVMAKHYKIENNKVGFNKMKKGVSKNPKISGLNFKQRLLLNSPLFILKFIKKIKLFFVKKGIRFSTYG